jgi:hypothetical protein
MKQLTDNAFAIPMPKGAEGCELRGAYSERPYPLLSFYGEGPAVELPPGEYEILVFNTSTATEEDARKVVEHDAFIDGYKDYDTDRFHHDTPFIKAIDSLASLLRSKNLEGNYAIIKKLNP